MTVLSVRGLVLAGAALLLAGGGTALVGAVASASAPQDRELGPPVVVGTGAPAPTSPSTGPSRDHHDDGDDGDDGDEGHDGGPTVVAPPPVHEVDDDRPTSTHR